MEIPKTIIDIVLAPYRPRCRYLAEAYLDYPRANGLFRAPHSAYVERNAHLHATDLLICFNQLTYAMLAEAGRHGMIEKLGKIPIEEFQKRQLTHYLITRMDNIEFRKMINPHEFRGTVDLKRVSKRRSLCLFEANYNFEDGKATGDVDFAMLLSDS